MGLIPSSRKAVVSEATDSVSKRIDKPYWSGPSSVGGRSGTPSTAGHELCAASCALPTTWADGRGDDVRGRRGPGRPEAVEGLLVGLALVEETLPAAIPHHRLNFAVDAVQIGPAARLGGCYAWKHDKQKCNQESEGASHNLLTA